MRKLTFLALFIIATAFVGTDAFAQTSQSSTLSTKDEYWGTSKVEKATTVDAVSRRGEGLDTRFNAYETSKRNKTFDKKRIANSKRMKAILKKEEKMMKKHKRDKRRLRRSRL